MTTHDELAYAVAIDSISQIRAGAAPWASLFSSNSRVSSSRDWPVPDFVLRDDGNNLTVAAEFKPPGQSKREYLTGLGQAVAYTKDFDYGLLIVPHISDDGYQIANHIRDVLSLNEFNTTPVGLVEYDPRRIGPSSAAATISKFFGRRLGVPPHRAQVGESFYAKWREMSPEEMALYLGFLYEEKMRPSRATPSLRDRGFGRLWAEIQAGRVHHWAGGVRHASASTEEAVRKNYRNFMNHVGWMESDGALTEEGLAAWHVAHIYGFSSRMFLNSIARSLLLAGKHLILINAINQFQDHYLSQQGPFPDEQTWLGLIECDLENRGLLKRNTGRHAAAVQNSGRQFLKAEKQLWKNTELIIPRTAARVYHQGRGFVFNWARITELVMSQ